MSGFYYHRLVPASRLASWAAVLQVAHHRGLWEQVPEVQAEVSSAVAQDVVTLYLVTQEGVHRQALGGVFSVLKDATDHAQELARTDKDNYHEYFVIPVRLDQAMPFERACSPCLVGAVGCGPGTRCGCEGFIKPEAAPVFRCVQGSEKGTVVVLAVAPA